MTIMGFMPIIGDVMVEKGDNQMTKYIKLPAAQHNICTKLWLDGLITELSLSIITAFMK